MVLGVFGTVLSHTFDSIGFLYFSEDPFISITKNDCIFWLQYCSFLTMVTRPLWYHG